MLLTKSRVSLISIGLILLMGLATFLLVERASADDWDRSGLAEDSVVWNWHTSTPSGTTVAVDFNIDAALDGQIVEIEVFVSPTTDTAAIHTQRMGNFGAFPTGKSLSFNFVYGTDLTGKTLGIHLMKRVDGSAVLVVASNTVGVVPTPIAAPLTPPKPTPTAAAPTPTATAPTPTATATAPTPTATPTGPPTATPTATPFGFGWYVETPPTGDFAPGSGLLLALMLAGFLLIAAGGTYMAMRSRSDLG